MRHSRAFSGLALRCVGGLGLAVCCRSLPAVAAESACPSREAVEDAARPLLSIAAGGDDALRGRVSVRDLGARYTVTVKGRTRSYADQGRDCEARARAAAVFVALTLSPSGPPPTPAPPAPPKTTPLSPPPPPAAPPPPPPTAPPSPPPPTVTRSPPVPPPDSTAAPTNRADTGRRPADATAVAATAGRRADTEFQGTDVELGAVGAMAPRTDGSQFVLAPELHVAVTRGGWGVALGGAFPSASTLNLPPARVREVRTPIDLGVRRGWGVGWFRTGLELGAVAAICRFQQLDVMNAATTTKLELGGRAAVSLAAESPRVGLYLRLSAELLPLTRQIAVEPRGIIGRTSRFWAGAAVGVTVRFH